MVQRIDFRPEIATPPVPNEPAVDAVRRKLSSHVVDLTPALLSLRDPRLMPLLVRRQRVARVPSRPVAGQRAPHRGRDRRRGEDDPLGGNVDLAA